MKTQISSSIIKARKKQFLYLKQFIRSPRTMGTVVPSSRFLCREILRGIPWEQCLNIVELGSGDGVLTKKILERMGCDAKLTAYEIREEFAEDLELIGDPRLSVCSHSAEKLSGEYDLIISCLPLLSLPKEVSEAILTQCAEGLRSKDGIFVQFQYSRLSEKLLSEYFLWNRKYVLRNIPPAFVYHCKVK